MNHALVCGIDEAGRGPLAGPVIAAAVILDEKVRIVGLADSKQLKERRREVLAGEIRTRSIAWALGRAEPAEIDEINILQATLLAMARAVAALPVTPVRALVDGNAVPRVAMPAEAIVGGDASVPAISAASILGGGPPSLLLPEAGDYLRSALSANWVYDTRDALIETREGSKLDVGVSVAGTFLGGDVEGHGGAIDLHQDIVLKVEPREEFESAVHDGLSWVAIP